MTEDQPTDAEPDTRGDNHVAAVWMILGVSLVLAVILGALGANADDLETKAGLGAWSNYFLIVAAIALVGGLVLTGVRGWLRRAGLL